TRLSWAEAPPAARTSASGTDRRPIRVSKCVKNGRARPRSVAEPVETPRQSPCAALSSGFSPCIASTGGFLESPLVERLAGTAPPVESVGIALQVEHPDA